MTESIFKTRTVQEIYDEIKKLYQSDNRPWIIGYSGGKDSTCMTQLVWNALLQLNPEDRHKKVFIIGSDTLVESPKIAQRLSASLKKMQEIADESQMPFSTHVVGPELEDTFWVCLLGRGYPAPTNQFRWCTDRLKIKNVDRFIIDKVSQFGEAIVLLGTRKDESASRQQLLNLYEVKGSLLNRHSKYAQTYMYCPLKEFVTEDVWNYLLQNKNPWKDNNRDLLAMYQEANASECPMVVDTSTPSCGNSRFGCWTCTVVDRDKSLDSMIEGGEEWLEPLAELRAELKRTQDPAIKKEVREFKRRNGRVMFCYDSDEVTSQGPYTLNYCQGFLEKLLVAQKSVQKNGPDPNMVLIGPDEIHEIQRIWRMERGDWKNSAYEIYEKIIGIRLEQTEDLGGFGQVEQEVLETVCSNNDVSPVLVSRLLHAEFESQGMTRHSKIFPKLTKILAEEWRDDLNEIVSEMREQKHQKKKYSVPKKPAPKKGGNSK